MISELIKAKIMPFVHEHAVIGKIQHALEIGQRRKLFRKFLQDVIGVQDAVVIFVVLGMTPQGMKTVELLRISFVI